MQEKFQPAVQRHAAPHQKTLSYHEAPEQGREQHNTPPQRRRKHLTEEPLEENTATYGWAQEKWKKGHSAGTCWKHQI